MEFKGIRQYSLEAFNNLSDSEKKGCLSFVRELDLSGSVIDYHIFFGTREYGNGGMFYQGDDVDPDAAE